MPGSFEQDLFESVPFLLAMQDDGFAKRFAVVLTSNRVLCSLDGGEQWAGSPEEIARLIVELRGRGESHCMFIESGNSTEAYVEEEVVVRAMEQLGWRIAVGNSGARFSVFFTPPAEAVRLQA